MDNYHLFVMDKDYCPDNDSIIYRNACDNCDHYNGFQLENGERCIKCSFYEDLERKQKENNIISPHGVNMG